MYVYAVTNNCEHVLFADLILLKIKKCSHHPKSKSDHHQLIKNEEKKQEKSRTS